MDTDRTSAPEPASVLGLLAVGALGAGSSRKRKQSQKAEVHRLKKRLVLILQKAFLQGGF